MANDDIKKLATERASDVLRTTDRKSVGLVRIVAESAGTPGEVREYQDGDEALVEAGRAQWVVAPVHSPEAGRRLDTDAEREAAPAGGIEAFPPADGDPLREEEARRKGYVEAHTDSGVGERLAAKRAELVREDARDDSDAKAQAAAGGFGARSGPADLSEAKLLERSGVSTDTGARSTRTSGRGSKES